MMPHCANDFMGYPQAKFDELIVGGRYDGVIWDEKRLTLEESDRRSLRGLIDVGNNVRPVVSLRPDFVPFAIVTPDGTWRDCEQYVSDARWDRTAKEVLHTHSECVAVAIDCHH